MISFLAGCGLPERCGESLWNWELSENLSGPFHHLHSCLPSDMEAGGELLKTWTGLLVLQQCLRVPPVSSESRKAWFLSSPFLRFLFYSPSWFLQITYWPEDTVAPGYEPLCFLLPRVKTSISAPILTSSLTLSEEEDLALPASQPHLPLCLQGPNSTPPPPNSTSHLPLGTGLPPWQNCFSPLERTKSKFPEATALYRPFLPVTRHSDSFQITHF